MKRSADAKQHAISSQTAWRRWQRGESLAQQLPSGTVMVNVPPALPADRHQKVAGSARVSSAEHHTNLDRQADRVAAFCAATGWPVAKGVKEGGSGAKEQRPPCLALLSALSDPRIRHRVVDHTDRCARFGVASLQTWLKTPGQELVSVKGAAAGPEDLRQDFVAISTRCGGGRSGRRQASRKETQWLAVLEGN